MQKVKLSKYHQGNPAGTIIEVDNNTAHSLIDGQIAKLYRSAEQTYSTRQMRAGKYKQK